MSAPLALCWALAVWWTSNTIAHHVIHRPFFRRRSANRLFAAALSIASGYPQRLWRDRHLAHHAGVAPRLRVSGELIAQSALVIAWWVLLLEQAPMFFASVYIPGYIGGLLLCAVHGYYEHAGGTISHYGRLYNLLLFNDGYHVEHHAHPGVRWSRLPERRDRGARSSAWPAPLRWVEAASRVSGLVSWVLSGFLTAEALAKAVSRTSREVLEALERLVLQSSVLQRFVLATHERALRRAIAELRPPSRVAIVGGGLFPRTALILRKVLPAAQLTIIDANRANLDRTRDWLALDGVKLTHARYQKSEVTSGVKSEVTSDVTSEVDLIVFPLSFDGDREALYARPPAPAVIVHDWLWRRRGTSRVVSVALLKRVNLVRR